MTFPVMLEPRLDSCYWSFRLRFRSGYICLLMKKKMYGAFLLYVFFRLSAPGDEKVPINSGDFTWLVPCALNLQILAVLMCQAFASG
jgi:hypothetical protein